MKGCGRLSPVQNSSTASTEQFFFVLNIQYYNTGNKSMRGTLDPPTQVTIIFFAGEGAPYVLDSGAIKRARCAHAVIIPRLLYQEQVWLVFSAQK